MAAQGNIVLTDGAGTPVNHTFVSKGTRVDPKTGKQVATWKVPSTINAEGDQILKQHFSEGLGAEGVTKHTYVLTRPVLQTVGTNDAGITPPAQKAYENIAVLEFRTSRRSSSQERKDLVKMIADLAAEAVTLNEIENRETVW